MGRKLYFTILIAALLSLSSSVWGDTVSILLEEGIYAEETKGDLDEAISIYQRIIDENYGNMVGIAKAYFRLGSCYLKRGDEKRAIEMFKELLTRFSEHEEIALETRNQLANLNALDEESQGDQPLKIGPAPWESGETCIYNLKSMAGYGIGKQIISVKETSKNGSDLWTMETYLGVPLEDAKQYTRIDLLKGSFKPVSMTMTDPRGTVFSTLYENGHIQLDIAGPDTNVTREIPINQVVYDNEQVVYLLRRLPLKENYSASFPVFPARNGNIINSQFRIQGIETVTVPAGKFDCYYFEAEPGPGVKHKVWYSTAEKRCLVKYDSGQLTMELEKVEQGLKNGTVGFQVTDPGVAITAPAGWQFITSDFTGNYNNLVQILSPEIKSSTMFVCTPHGGVIKTIEDTVKGDVDLLKKALKNYVVRSDSWESDTISGLASLGFTADYEQNGKKRVEKRVYILGPSDVYWFVFRVEKDLFEEFIPDFNFIANSFKKN